MARALSVEHGAGMPRAYPVLGHLPSFLADKLGFLSSCMRGDGSALELSVGGPTLLLRDAEDVRHVLVSNARNYEKSGRLVGGRGQRLYGEGLLTLAGEEHLARRRLLSPIYRPTAVKDYVELAGRAAREAGEAWSDGGEVEIDGEMALLGERIMSEMLFGLDAREQERQLGDAIRTRRDYVEHAFGSLLPGAEHWPLPINLRYRRAKARIDAVIDACIARARERGARFEGGPGPPPSLIERIVALCDASDAPPSEAALRDEVSILAVAGFETTGEWFTWTWYLLARNPEIQERLAEEVLGTLGDRPPAADDLSSLPYTEKVLAESLRLYPPTWMFVRFANQDDVLPSGVRVRAGHKLYLCQYVLQRDPRYFPDPDRFDPERFAASTRSERPGYAYFPFGAGVRQCIGEGLARVEATTVVASLARRWRFEWIPGQEVVPWPGVTLRTRHGIRLRVRQRQA